MLWIHQRTKPGIYIHQPKAFDLLNTVKQQVRKKKKKIWMIVDSYILKESMIYIIVTVQGDVIYVDEMTGPKR